MKLLRLYAVVAIFLISSTVFLSSFIIADENAKKISLGENYAVVAFEMPPDFSPKDIINKLKEKIINAIS